MCIVRVKLILKHVRLAILDWINIINRYRKYLSFEQGREKETLYCSWIYQTRPRHDQPCHIVMYCMIFHVMKQNPKNDFIRVFAIWRSLCSEFLFSINGNVFRKLTLSPDKRGGTYTFPEGFIWLSIPVIIVYSSLCHNAQAGTI